MPAPKTLTKMVLSLQKAMEIPEEARKRMEKTQQAAKQEAERLRREKELLGRPA